jgi:hypothetical protein
MADADGRVAAERAGAAAVVEFIEDAREDGCDG